LDEISRQSGGMSMYIDSAAKVTKFFRDCIHSLSAVVARDLNLTLRLANNVRLQEAFRASPYLERMDVGQGPIFLGQLGTDQPCMLLLTLLIGPQNVGKVSIAQVELSADVPSMRRAGDRVKAAIEIQVATDVGVVRPVPSNIVSILSKVSIFKMQEKTMDELEQGEVERASQRLETMATRLLNLGENELAKAALLEAGRIARTGHLSPEGRKKIRYGTRSLATLPKEIGYD
jgi:Ca-activated chloride channel family protein